jgi:hypothetical protein
LIGEPVGSVFVLGKFSRSMLSVFFFDFRAVFELEMVRQLVKRGALLRLRRLTKTLDPLHLAIFMPGDHQVDLESVGGLDRIWLLDFSRLVHIQARFN